MLSLLSIFNLDIIKMTGPTREHILVWADESKNCRLGNTFGTKLGQESSIVLWHIVHGELKSERLNLPS